MIKVLVGHSIDLPCVAQGVPQPSVSWMKNSTVLLVDGFHYKLSSDGTLTIREVTLSDEGVHTCMATSNAGQDTSSIQLQVQSKCEFFLSTFFQTIHIFV